MMTSTLYLVSQHFGRIVAVVHTDEKNATGVVHLLAEDPVALSIEFTFSVNTVLMYFGTTDNLVEVTIRHAMSHALKLFKKNAILRPRVVLDFGGSPWIGDLLSEPYGGATMGIKARERQRRGTSYPTVERRSNTAASRIVQRAILSQQFHGPQAALALMNANKVPEHIIARILSRAALRRR